MFRTYAAAEISTPASKDPAQAEVSTFVEVMFQLLWFIGTFSEARTDDQLLHTVLARDVVELKAIGRSRNWDLIQVDIAVPPGESQTGEWEFERLVAAWECEDSRYEGGIAIVYCSIQGIDYTDVLPPIEPFDPSKLRRLRRIYPTRKTRHSEWSRVRGRAPVNIGGADGP